MILCVGLSPTVQRTLFLDRFVPGEVNRAREVIVTASGKAINVARVIRLLNGRSHLIQIVGGDSGRFITQALDFAGIPHDSIVVRNDAPTRTCITLLADNASATELVEEVAPVSIDDVLAVTHTVRQNLSHARALCLSGSFPAGVPTTFYAELVNDAKNHFGLVTVVDAQKAPLREALAAHPFLVKPNLEEATATLGLTRTGDDQADVWKAVEGLRAAGAVWALVSTGRRGSLLGGPDGSWWIEPPAVDALNTIGSGDSLTAGFLHAHVEQNKPVPEAAAYGTACAAANVLTATSGVVRPEDVEELLPRVRITPYSPDRAA